MVCAALDECAAESELIHIHAPPNTHHRCRHRSQWDAVQFKAVSTSTPTPQACIVSHCTMASTVPPTAPALRPRRREWHPRRVQQGALVPGTLVRVRVPVVRRGGAVDVEDTVSVSSSDDEVISAGVHDEGAAEQWLERVERALRGVNTRRRVSAWDELTTVAEQLFESSDVAMDAAAAVQDVDPAQFGRHHGAAIAQLATATELMKMVPHADEEGLNVAQKLPHAEAQCAICVDDVPANAPHTVVLPCGHVYCRVCIETWFAQCQEGMPCPTCRTDAFDELTRWGKAGQACCPQGGMPPSLANGPAQVPFVQGLNGQVVVE